MTQRECQKRTANAWVLSAMVLAVCAGVARGEEEKASCVLCHTTEAAQHPQSIHAQLRCQDCHGGQSSYPLAPEDLKKYLPALGNAASAFDHGTPFRGKPARADVPNFCGTCHADVATMNPYGLPTDPLARYWSSGHGKTLKDKADDRVAVCIDCHGTHDVLPASDPASRTHPTAVPTLCGKCHADKALMDDFDLSVNVVDEYRRSVHGVLLLDQGDTGAPTCVTCHGHHASMPSGFASVGDVCGKCHQHADLAFAKSIHSQLEFHKGCVQCHGGGEGRHFHLIERITKPPGVLIQRYANLLANGGSPSPEQVTESIHSGPREIMEHALPTCLECHDDIEDDESLPKLFGLLDEIAAAERSYVATADHLDEVGRGVLLVDNQRFKLEDAKTYLIQLAPLQHTLDNALVGEKVDQLNAVCDEIHEDLDNLERGLAWRRRALVPIWGFALVFAGACYVKYKRLKKMYVTPAATPTLTPTDAEAGA